MVKYTLKTNKQNSKNFVKYSHSNVVALCTTASLDYIYFRWLEIRTIYLGCL